MNRIHTMQGNIMKMKSELNSQVHYQLCWAEQDHMHTQKFIKYQIERNYMKRNDLYFVSCLASVALNMKYFRARGLADGDIDKL